LVGIPNIRAARAFPSALVNARGAAPSIRSKNTRSPFASTTAKPLCALAGGGRRRCHHHFLGHGEIDVLRRRRRRPTRARPLRTATLLRHDVAANREKRHQRESNDAAFHFNLSWN
jgi:hypothetical protein